MKKAHSQCSRCRGSGFILSYDCGVSGCEEYKDCPKCFGIGGGDEIMFSETPIIIEYKKLKENNKIRKIIL